MNDDDDAVSIVISNTDSTHFVPIPPSLIHSPQASRSPPRLAYKHTESQLVQDVSTMDDE